jgi:hypothetical protein
MGDLDAFAANTPAARKATLEKLAAAMKTAGLDPADLGSVDRIKFYEGFHKDDQGDTHTVPMVSFQVNPSWADGPAWPVVQPAKPTTVRPATTKRTTLKGWHKAVILPDPQIGFRCYDDGTRDPFHDYAALDVAHQLLNHIRPDVVVNLGDFLDLPAFSRFTIERSFISSTQPAVDAAHHELAEQKANAPEAEVHLLEGNHDRRLENHVVKNAVAAFGLRQANAPESWPTMSVPHLLRLDELGVTYHGGYPANEYWINDNLVAIHGAKVNSAGSTAMRYIEDERVSILFGHVHRIERIHRTRRTREGRRETLAASPGCLSRVDGAVPSVKSSTDAFGRPLVTWENWQQGVAVVTFQEGDGLFSLEQVPILEGRAMYRDHLFESRLSTVGEPL